MSDYTSVSVGSSEAEPYDDYDKSATAAGRYESLLDARQPYLQRARDASLYTIPSLYPPMGFSAATALYKPNQSVGAECVTSLASKLLMTLYPPGQPNFRLSLDEFVKDELAQTQGEDAPSKLEAVLSKIEIAITNHMETTGSRKVDYEALLHWVVAGNGLIYIDKKGKKKFFPLDRYVLCRDLDDNVIEIIVQECISKAALPAVIQEIVARNSDPNGKAGYQEKDIEVYTWVQRQDNGSWKVHQEVMGEVVPGSEGTYPAEASAWIPLRGTKIAGESYGRGKVEEYIGDFISLEALSKSIVDISKATSKVLAFVDESGTTSKEEVARSASGAILDGRAKDVTFLQVEKNADFSVTERVLETIVSRLKRAFLTADSAQRQAERVTAEEIRLIAGELDRVLGGSYSGLAEEKQRPELARYLDILPKIKALRIPALPKGTIRPQIVTGLDGLGRNVDMQRLDALLQGVAELFGPDELKTYVNLGEYVKRRGNALGVNTDGLINDQATVDASNKQAQTQQMIEKLGPQAIKGISDNINQRQAQGQPQPGPPQQPAAPVPPGGGQ